MVDILTFETNEFEAFEMKKRRHCTPIITHVIPVKFPSHSITYAFSYELFTIKGRKRRREESLN